MKLRFLGQVILQVTGLYYAAIKYRKKGINSIDGVTKKASHSWDILPQRFAYDFIIVDEGGKSYQGDKEHLQSYYCYGKDILAPADGVVVSIKNNFPDCRIMSDGEPDPDTPDIGGNRIIIKHSANEYSVACHLMPGSAVVQKGQTVKRGDIIAKCGNSGNTTEPHIHFQVQNTARFYSSIGVPILFSNIQKKVYAGHDLINPFPLPEKEDIKDGYIQRGLLVKNTDNE